MNRFLFVLALIVIGIICVGFYMGWFRMDSTSSDGKSHITLTVDQKKIKESEDRALEKVGLGKSKAEGAQSSEAVK